jgi:hypothetical protein
MSVIVTGAFASLWATSMPANPAPIITTWGRVFVFMFFPSLSSTLSICEILHNYYNQIGLICKVPPSQAVISGISKATEQSVALENIY